MTSAVQSGDGSRVPIPTASDVISVILPVLNGERTLGLQLGALAHQTYAQPWELIIADNGSSDRSRAVAESWRGQLPQLVVVDASLHAGRAAACNAGARVARGDTFVFCDDDDVARPDWLAACADAARTHDLVAGALDHYTLDPHAPPWKRRVLSRPPRMPGSRPFADGSNMTVSRRAFEAVGGFCEELHRAEDVDLTWRLEAAGFPLHFASAAVMAKRGRMGCRAIWRQSVAWGAADVAVRRRHPPRRSDPADATAGRLSALLSDERLRDRTVLLALVSPRHHRSWLAAAARAWGRLSARIAPGPDASPSSATRRAGGAHRSGPRTIL